MYEIFEKLLAERGVTTYQVAKATGIATASFTGWKQGKWNFKQDKLQKIADYFGVPLSYLMGTEEELKIRMKQELEEVAAGLTEIPEFARPAFEYFGITLSKSERDIFALYSQLNEKGKQKALDYIQDLTKLEEYTHNEPKHLVTAAHGDGPKPNKTTDSEEN